MRRCWPALATWGALVIAAAAFSVPAAALEPEADAESAFPGFYRDVSHGSEVWFNPVSSFGAYSLDTLQVPESFSMSNSGQHLKEMGENLIHPFEAIDEEGGWKHFVNQQILPIDPEDFDESVAMIPDYALHLLGGGLVYRKNVEWLELHGFPFPRTAASSGTATTRSWPPPSSTPPTTWRCALTSPPACSSPGAGGRRVSTWA